MRVLHIANYANVPAVLKKYQVRLGHNVDIVDNDLVNLRTTTNYWEYDPNIVACHGGDEVVKWVYGHADDYDVLHCHGDALGGYPDSERELTGKKPTIIHIHGYELKNMNMGKVHRYKAFLVSTPDLYDEGIFRRIWLPNPIDLEMWKHEEHKGNRALWVHQYDMTSPADWNGARKLVEAKAKELGLELTVIERWHDFRPYMSMPDFYSNFDVLLEYKPNSNYAPNKFNEAPMGLTALEALASGLRVYFMAWGQWLTEFPTNHEAASVVKQLDGIYANL